MNQLILGDCLEVMQKMDSESVDLIYLDPPLTVITTDEKTYSSFQAVFVTTDRNIEIYK
jgi:DNA modification methylase